MLWCRFTFSDLVRFSHWISRRLARGESLCLSLSGSESKCKQTRTERDLPLGALHIENPQGFLYFMVTHSEKLVYGKRLSMSFWNLQATRETCENVEITSYNIFSYAKNLKWLLFTYHARCTIPLHPPPPPVEMIDSRIFSIYMLQPPQIACLIQYQTPHSPPCYLFTYLYVLYLCTVWPLR